MKTLTILLFLILGISSSFAQKTTNFDYKKIDSLFLISYKKGNYSTANDHAKIALAKAEIDFGLVDSIYGHYCSRLGIANQAMGEYREAEKFYSEALSIFEKTIGSNSSKYAITLNNIAIIYEMTGRYTKAEKIYLQALQIYATIYSTNHPKYALVLTNLALVYKKTGQYEKAKNMHLRVKDIQAKTIGTEHPKYAFNLSNLAIIISSLGDKEEAKNLFIQAKTIFAKTIGLDHPYYANTLNNIANIYLEAGDYDKAEEIYLQVQKNYAKKLPKNHPKKALLQASLAQLYFEKKNYEKAKKAFLKAAEIRKKTFGTKHPVYSKSLYLIAEFYSKTNQLALAYDYCIQSISANSPHIDSSSFDLKKLIDYDYYSYSLIISSLNCLATISEKQYLKTADLQKREDSYILSKSIISINEKNRNRISNDNDKLKILKTTTFSVNQAIDLALALGNESYQKETFLFAEKNKSILLEDAIKGSNAISFGDLPDSLKNKEILLQKEMAKLNSEQYKPLSPEKKNKINNAINELELKTANFIKSIQDKYPKYHALKYKEITASVEEIQTLLDEKTLLLEYFVGDSMVYLFAIDQTNTKLYPIPINKILLNKNISTLHSLLSSYKNLIANPDTVYKQYTQSAHWFYQLFLEKALEKKENIENLLIITDGELGHLPFEAFLVKKPATNSSYSDLNYLINDYNISYNYSATLWKENIKKTKSKHNNQLFACAADYKNYNSNTNIAKENAIRKTLIPLDAATSEVQTLSKHFSGMFLFDDQASEKMFKKEAPKYGIIHLAMHGLLDQETPMLSSLVFTDVQDTIENNFLQAHEISTMNLNAELVVLSACETGYGKFEQGEGIISLARSFMYAGTPSLVVSLWSVNDVSTSIIMQSFYQNIMDGMTKDVALRQAKIDYIQKAEGIAAHPVFWSPFIQLGDSKAITIQKKGNLIYWGLGGGLSLLLFGGLWVKRRKKEVA